MFAPESFRLVNYTLKDIIKLDKYRLKILKNLGKLVKEQYRLQNLKLANDYSIMYLKLYKRLATEYKGSIYLDGSSPVKDVDKQMKEKKYLNPKYMDRVLNIYMNCRQFLVGNGVYKMVQTINTSLPIHEQWEVFTSYNQIYEADGRYNYSNYCQKLYRRHFCAVSRLIKQYNYLEQDKSARLYSKLFTLQ
jgi:hypothetical protein